MILILIPGTWLDRSLWGAWVLMFGVLEYIGVRRKWGATSLTDLTLSVVPRWLLVVGLSLLWWHFLVQHR